MPIDRQAWLALGFTLIAGLSTGIGSLIAYLIKKPKMGILAFSLGLSSGVMLYISFVELFAGSVKGLGEIWGTVWFFAGIAFTALIDLLIPEAENPHEMMIYSDIEKIKSGEIDNKPLVRSSLLMALAITLHNFPEGMAAFGTTLSDTKLGIITMIAIAVHNIPEGMSVSVPIYYATGSKRKAFFFSFLSGLAEPVGAIIGFLILRPFLNEKVLAAMLAVIAGIMVYISLDEMLPLAHRYGKGHTVLSGLLIGMGIMAISLILL